MDNYRTETVSSNIIVYRWTILLSLTFVIIMEFFVDNSTSRILSVLALAFAYAISFLSNSFMGKVPRWLGICAVIVVLCLLGSIFYPAEYSQSYGIQAFLILFLLVNISYNSEYFVDDSAAYDLIYYVIFFLTIAYSLICYSKSGIDGIANMLNDGNLTSVWWLLCFMLALKRSHIIGIAICLVYTFLINQSRGFLLSFAVLILLLILKKVLPQVNDFLSRINFFYLFIILTVLMIVFSFFWVFVVSAHGTVNYHEGLNDGSNRLRFIANVNAVYKLRDVEHTLFWGVGDGIYRYLGITGETYASHTRMLGVRIVQPHNSIINLFLRIGLIPTIIYVYCLSQLLKSLNHEENVAYIFSFIISAMFLPLLLSSGWLIAWFLVLLVPSRETKKIRVVWHKR
jgi:hypothetical protein